MDTKEIRYIETVARTFEDEHGEGNYEFWDLLGDDRCPDTRFKKVDYGWDGWDRYIVFTFEGRLYKKYGYEDSWEAGHWDGPLVKCVAKEITVTVYEDVR